MFSALLTLKDTENGSAGESEWKQYYTQQARFFRPIIQNEISQHPSECRLEKTCLQMILVY